MEPPRVEAKFRKSVPVVLPAGAAGVAVVAAGKVVAVGVQVRVSGGAVPVGPV